MTAVHKFSLRIYYEDTDAGGIVYHANFLAFAERARTEMLRDIGFSNIELDKERGIFFIVRRAICDYRSPGFLEDALEVHTGLKHIKNSSFVLRQTVVRPEDDTILCDMDIVLVCVQKSEDGGIKPVKLPEEIRQGFVSYEIDSA